MKHTVNFTHLVTGKTITIARDSQTNRFPVAAIIHGPMKDPKTGKESLDEKVWLILEKVPNPLPVQETEQEVLKLLELDTDTKE